MGEGEKNNNLSLDKEEIISSIWKERENAKAYLENSGLAAKIKKCEQFYLGNQWATPTKRTKHMPRPVFNFTKKTVDHKVSNICGSPTKINFIAEMDAFSTTRMTKFYDYITKEMQLKKVNERCLTTGGITGSYAEHFYFDDQAIGRKGNYSGGVRVQEIHPLSIYFANPQEEDVQRQEWIILEERLNVKYVKEKIADKKFVKDLDLITKDDYEGIESLEEQEGSDLCTVLTKYFRIDGEVYFQRATKSVLLHEPICHNPRVVEKKLKENKEGKINAKIDAPNENASSNAEKDVDNEQRLKAYLYPIAFKQWDYNIRSIYGKGEVEDIIEVQKAINKEVGITLYDSQINGWTKVLVKANALKGQEITDEPGQVITDYTPSASWGIAKFEGQSQSRRTIDLAASVVDLSRNATNSSDVITGDMVSRDLSGTAIAQMQAQANKPIEKLQKNFWRFKEDEARILLQFFLLYYDNKQFTYELAYDEKKNLQKFSDDIGQNIQINDYNLDMFNGEDFEDINFDIQVEAGAGTQYSEIMAIDVLNNLFLGGAINNLDSERLEQYMELAPDSYIPFKDKMKEIIKAQQQTELAQAKQQIIQLSQQVEQLQTYIKEQQQAVESMKAQSDKSIMLTDKLKKEYSDKITTLKNYTSKLEQKYLELAASKSQEKKQVEPTSKQ